jgi:phosphoribosylamine-glycine ligase
VKILIFSPSGDGVGLAHQLESEGHQVAVHFVRDFDARQGENMVWRSANWQVDARQADFTLFDNNGHGEKADNLRKNGAKVWCGGLVADRLEHDRQFGMAVMRKTGIPIPETFDFTNGPEARDVVREQFKGFDRVVIKLNDVAAAATSYVSKDRADVLAQIDSWIETNPDALAHGGIIQRFIPGIEISIEGWFNGDRFLYPFNWTMEDKKLLSGNLGPNVGCAFSMVRQMRSEKPRFAKTFLDPLVPILKAGKYVGQVDVNTIISEEDGTPYALEFTPRPGYEGTSNLSLALGGLGRAIGIGVGVEEGYDLVDGSERPWDFVGALRLWVPPYPFEPATRPLYEKLYEEVRGVPVTKMPSVEDGFVPYDVMLDDSGKAVMSGTCGVVGVTIARGRTPEEATEGCLKIAQKLEVPNLAWRSDAGQRVSKQLPTIEATGLLK